MQSLVILTRKNVGTVAQKESCINLLYSNLGDEKKKKEIKETRSSSAFWSELRAHSIFMDKLCFLFRLVNCGYDHGEL